MARKSVKCEQCGRGFAKQCHILSHQRFGTKCTPLLTPSPSVDENMWDDKKENIPEEFDCSRQASFYTADDEFYDDHLLTDDGYTEDGYTEDGYTEDGYSDNYSDDYSNEFSIIGKSPPTKSLQTLSAGSLRSRKPFHWHIVCFFANVIFYYFCVYTPLSYLYSLCVN